MPVNFALETSGGPDGTIPGVYARYREIAAQEAAQDDPRLAHDFEPNVVRQIKPMTDEQRRKVNEASPVTRQRRRLVERMDRGEKILVHFKLLPITTAEFDSIPFLSNAVAESRDERDAQVYTVWLHADDRITPAETRAQVDRRAELAQEYPIGEIDDETGDYHPLGFNPDTGQRTHWPVSSMSAR